VQYSGRVEAKITVPTGGAAFSASNGAQSAAQALTIPAGDYFLSSSGGLSSLLTTMQTQLNENVQGYPLTASAMQAAVGYGTWAAGYRCNETSGNLASAFGAPATLTASSTPTYGASGPRGGVDLAIGFDSIADAFDGGNVFDPGANDLVIACVFKFGVTPGGTVNICGKVAGGLASGWALYADTNNIGLAFNDGAIKVSVVSIASFIGEWCVLLGCIERGSTNLARFAIRGLTSGTTATATSTSVGGNVTNALAFRLGNTPWADAAAGNMAAVWAGSGSGAATGLAANITTAVANLANAINGAWTVSLSTTDGRITIANSFWPSTVSFTNTTLRDVLGYAYDFDAPQTTAQLLTSLLGYGFWSSGWLMNEASGTLVDSFGAANLLASFGISVYGNVGARGGNDKAVSFDTGTDQFSAGDVLDAAGDFVLAWVAKFNTVGGANGDIVGKGWTTAAAGQVQYLIARESDGVSFYAKDSAGGTYQSACSGHIGQWHVGIAVLDRIGGTLRVGTRALTTGTESLGANTAFVLPTVGNAQNFVFGACGAYGAALNVTVGAMYAGFVGTGLPPNLSAALSNFATYMKSQTSTKQARGLWFPDSPIFVKTSDPRMAPLESDARSTLSPTGKSITLVGNYFRMHRSVSWSHSPIDRIREGSATYANASWRQFWDDTQLGKGLSWFPPGAALLIVDESGNVLGSDINTTGKGPTNGWQVVDPGRVQPQRADAAGYTGFWNIELPELIAQDV
jgi:hypothetical protein